MPVTNTPKQTGPTVVHMTESERLALEAKNKSASDAAANAASAATTAQNAANVGTRMIDDADIIPLSAAGAGTFMFKVKYDT